MAHIATQKSELSNTLMALIEVLPTLFKKMQESKIALHLMNLPHEGGYEGKPLLHPFSSIDPSEVHVEAESLMIKHEHAVYRIYPSKNQNLLVTLKLFLKWATESLKQITNGVFSQKTLKVPSSVVFFSTSTLPPRIPVPLWR